MVSPNNPNPQRQPLVQSLPVIPDFIKIHIQIHLKELCDHIT